MLLRVSDVADIHDQWERARRRARVATRRKPPCAALLANLLEISVRKASKS
jgi:hypothetical protein